MQYLVPYPTLSDLALRQQKKAYYKGSHKFPTLFLDSIPHNTWMCVYKVCVLIEREQAAVVIGYEGVKGEE